MSTHHTTTINATRTDYWEYHPDAPVTLVMVHGFRGTHHGLELIAQQLPDFRVIIPDVAGFGASEPLVVPHTIDAYVEWLDGLCRHLSPDQPVYLVGHSFGTIVASHFAAHYPDRVKRLVLINPIGAPALQGPRKILTQLALVYYQLGDKLPGQLAHRWLSLPLVTNIMSHTMTKSSDPLLRRFIKDQHLTHFSTFAHPRQLSQAFDTSVRYDVSQVADKLTMPTLLIAGELDDITPIHKQRTLSGTIPHAQLHEIADVGHLTHYETPELVATAIRDYLN